jgi:hypothetical protein
VIDLYGRALARHADHDVTDRPDGAAEGELDRRGAGRIADQPVGLVQGEPVEGTRLGNAHRGESGASVVLQ